MKKILINCYEYPPEVHGGVGSFSRDLAEGLVSIGWQVYVVGIYYENNSPDLISRKEEIINGVNIIRLPQSNVNNVRLRIIFDRINLYKEIVKLHKKVKFDLLESPESTGWFPLGSPVRPFVVRMHGSQIYFDTLLERPPSRLWHWLEKRTIKKADALVAVSNYCGEKTLEFCGFRKDFVTIYNGIDIEKILKVKNEISSINYNDTYGRYIVFANSVIKKKGVEELISAFNIIGFEYPDLNLVIIGKSLGKVNNKPYTEYLYTLLDIDLHHKMFFTGWLNHHSDVFKILDKCGIAVYPSHMEGQGIAPTEAMILGKPVIFMNNGPGPEVIDHLKSGYLVNTKYPEAIAEAIRTLLDDKVLAEDIGEEAILKVYKDFDKSKWLQNNLEFYNKLFN